MKKLIFVLALFSSIVVVAQSDTIYYKDGSKIPVKVIEISDFDIKYKRTDLINGPVFFLNKENIRKIRYANGVEEFLMPDELLITQEVSEILKQKQCFKFHVFDIPAGKISLGYEFVNKVGFNTDFKVGFFNSNLLNTFTEYSFDRNRNIYNPYMARFSGGTFLKAGTKFLLGSDYTVKGMRYAHPLAGRYIRFDIYLSYVKFDDIKYKIPVSTLQNPNNLWPNYTYIDKSTDANNYNFGFLISYGRQFVLANMLTIEYYAGLGFNGSSYSFSQSDFGQFGPIYPSGYANYIGYYYNNGTQNVLAAQRLGKYISGTIGFSVGFIHKSSSKKKKDNSSK